MGKDWLKEILMIFIDVTITMFLVVMVFQLWNKDIHVPISYQNDGLGAVAQIKGMIEGNGIWERSYWSSPYGDSNYMVDYILQLFLVRIIILFTKDAAVIINVFWLLTYVLTAITTYLLLRHLNVRCSVSIMGSIIYNFLPYHYFRIEHFWLCGCYIVPLAVWLILDVLEITEKNGTYYPLLTGKIRISQRNVCNALLCVLIGLNGVYYAVFTVMLILIMGVLKSLSSKDIRYFCKSLLNTFFVFAPIVLFYILPAVVWGDTQITDVGATRSIYDIERYALKIAALFFPVQGHRITVLAQFTEKYSEIFGINNESYTVVLGLIMSVGLILSVLALFCKKIFKRNENLIVALGQIIIIIMLISCQGGLADYIGIFITSSIRCFNRMSIYIALCSLITVCVLLETLINKKHIRRGGELVIVCGLLILGVLDQTSEQFAEYSLFNPSDNEYQLSYQEKEEDYYQLKQYFSEIQNMVGDGATIYMLPRNADTGTDNESFAAIKAYVCSDDLKWSYSEWNMGYDNWFTDVEKGGIEVLLNNICVLDMSGILVDKLSYSTEQEFDDVCDQLESLTGSLPYVDEGGQLYFFDINDYKEKYLDEWKDEYEILRNAIDNQIDGVEIFSLNLNENDNEVEMTLEEGSYRITITGENLSTSFITVISNDSGEKIDIKNLEADDNQLSFDFKIKNTEENIDIRVEGGEENITIDACYCEKDTGSGFHDLKTYYQGILALKNANCIATTIQLDSTNLYITGNTELSETSQLELQNGQIQYGPYYSLEAGEYTVYIMGNNLNNAEVYVQYDFGQSSVEISTLEQTEDTIVYEFFLEESTDNIEICMINIGEEEISIDSYVCVKELVDDNTLKQLLDIETGK